jgi:excinuclease UvrABC nuclease subunit
MIKFNNTQKFTKINIAKIPQDKAIIYKIKDASGTNLYTGIAGRGRSQERLIEHKDIKKEVIQGGTRFQFVQAKNKEKAHNIEKKIIKDEQPKFNIQHK